MIASEGPRPLRPKGDSFAREARHGSRQHALKKGAGGGNMVSPALQKGARRLPSETTSPAAVGFVVIDVLLGYVRRHTYGLFVIYRLVLAAIIVIVILSGARDATF